MKLVTEQHNGAVFKIILGEQIAIQLPENPTTGYSWDSTEWVFPDNIDLLLNQYKALEPVTIGSGGYRRWVIKPNEAGTYRIELGYQRNGESNPARTFPFTLMVVIPEPLPKIDELKGKKYTNVS